MIAEIQSIITEHEKVKFLYGFGSFFRNGGANPFADIDILIVVSESGYNILSISLPLRRSFQHMERKYNVFFDLTFLTSQEFVGHTFVEQDTFVLLYVNERH